VILGAALRWISHWQGDIAATADLFEDAGIDGSLLCTIDAEELEALVRLRTQIHLPALG